jgi:uncharacterized Rossmann fold enzyme
LSKTSNRKKSKQDEIHESKLKIAEEILKLPEDKRKIIEDLLKTFKED